MRTQRQSPEALIFSPKNRAESGKSETLTSATESMEAEDMNAKHDNNEDKTEEENQKSTEPQNEILPGGLYIGGSMSGGAIAAESFTALAYLLPFASAAAGATATIVISWLKARRSNVTVEFHESGEVSRVSGTNLLDPQEFTDSLMERLNKASKVRILDQDGEELHVITPPKEDSGKSGEEER